MNSFTKIPLTESEAREGCIFNHFQRAYLQNMLADTAEQKLNLPFTPNDVLGYAQNEAFLKGQIELLGHLIDVSDETSRSVNLESQS